jgi:tellurite resistance protein
VLEARILGSLFEGPLPEPIRLTIGVELAPPVVATLAAAVLWPALPGDVLALGLGIAMVPFVAVAARAGWWAGLPFSTGFWSFSFPLAALAAAVIETVGRGGWPAWIGHAVLLAASAVIAYFTVRTLFLLVGGRLLPPTT